MKNISILIPTRKRAAMFVNAIESLYTTCESIDNFEVLVAVDKDDEETTNEICKYTNTKNNIAIYTFERQYYKGFHNYINALVPQSKGKSLFLWNDDCVMKSKNWDTEIIKYHKDFCILNPLVDTMINYCRTNKQILFPIIPKKWVEITGRWANNAACDTWIQDISRDLNLTVDVDSIVISHDRHDVTGNNNDIVYVEGREDVSSFIKNDFYSIPQSTEREIDKQKILSFLNGSK